MVDDEGKGWDSLSLRTLTCLSARDTELFVSTPQKFVLRVRNAS